MQCRRRLKTWPRDLVCYVPGFRPYEQLGLPARVQIGRGPFRQVAWQGEKRDFWSHRGVVVVVEPPFYGSHRAGPWSIRGC